MTQLIGLLMCVLGLLVGLYVGVWWAFIGGIVDVITEIRAADMSAINIAIGIAKVMFAGFFGYLSAIVLIIPGLALTRN